MSTSSARRDRGAATIVGTLIVAGLALGASSAQTAGSTWQRGMAWQTDLQKALADARVERRAVLLDFWADWCAPCKSMDADFWSRRDVAERSRRLICVRVDYDQRRSLAMQYDVRAIPAVVILDPWQNPIASMVGFGDTSRLELLLKQIPADFSDAAPWMAALEEDKKDLSALRGLGEFYYRHKFFTVSTHYFERALKSSAAKKDARARGDVQVALGWNHINTNENKRAREQFTQALQVPDLDRADVALFGLVVANLGLGKQADAEKALAELTSRFPDSPAAAEARERFAAAGTGGRR